MSKFQTLIPTSPMLFQVAWESTLKCNLDCKYCGDGHDNRTEHPKFAECLDTVDFIFDYVGIKMRNKPEHLRGANLNIQGGESFFHPDILNILKYIKNKKQEHDWYMGIAFITNAVVGPNLWKRALEYVDYYTITYHAEANSKQKQLVKNNILACKEYNSNFHVAVMMHPKHWDDCIQFIEWCRQNEVKCHARQIDHHWLDMRWNYNSEQSEYLLGRKVTTKDKLAYAFLKGLNLSKTGRACCGNHKLCASGCETTYVEGNNFKGWNCSVADYFLYIRQVTGEVYTNKDCKMNYNNQVGPIGYLSDTRAILDSVHTDPIICKKSSCWCGLCAPKAETKELFTDAMKVVQSPPKQ